MKYFKINDVLNMINNNLPKNKIKIIGEISKPQLSQGNLYFNLQDKEGSIKSIIWKSNLSLINYDLKDGDEIVVKGKLDLYKTNGSISLIISKIIKYNGEGDLHKIFQKNKRIFEKKGYFLKIHKLKIPIIIKNILILTSKNGKAITDIQHIFKKNKSKINYKLINIIVQGKNCPNSVSNELSRIKNKYDLIIITRGGGEFKDLFGFCHPDLIEKVFKFGQPIISAIGHKEDTTLLDLVADKVSSTPTDAAQYIIDSNRKYINNLKNKKEKLKNIIIQKQYDNLKKIKNVYNKFKKIKNEFIIELRNIRNSQYNKLYKIPNKKIKQLNNLRIQLKIESKFLQTFRNNIKNNLLLEIKSSIINLENIRESLNRKQDICIYYKNKKISTPTKLNKKISKSNNMILVWNNFKYKINIYKPELFINQI